MKKLALALVLAIAACGAALGAGQITADEAFRVALPATSDPIVGVWRMHPQSGGRVAHMAIVPNTTNKRQDWDYLGIMLEDGFKIKKNGVKIALRQTNSAHTYDVILSNTASKTGAVYMDGNGLAFLNGPILDMNKVEVPYVGVNTMFLRDLTRHAPIAHMVKVRYFQMDSADQNFSLSGLSFAGFRISAIEPGSLADRAGLKHGDTILEINGRSADEKTQKDIDAKLAAGRTVIIEFERNGKRDIATLK